MQPYPNPNYFNQSPYQNGYGQIGMVNPYADRANQFQQFPQPQIPQPQVNQQPMGLNCIIVDDFNAIVANDVPMDGRGAVFMKRDGSEIQWRNWSANGTIVTTPYKPFLEQNLQEGTNIPQMDFDALNEDMRALREEILSRLDSIEKSVAKSSGGRAKKAEVSVDE